MFGSFGLMELLIVLFIVLIVFGAGKLPQLGEGLGKAIKGFKKSIGEEAPDPSGFGNDPNIAQGGKGEGGGSTGHRNEQEVSQNQPSHSGDRGPSPSEDLSKKN